MENGLNKQEEQEYKEVISKATELLTSVVDDQIEELNSKAKGFNDILKNTKGSVDTINETVKTVKNRSDRTDTVIADLLEKNLSRFIIKSQDKVVKGVEEANKHTQKLLKLDTRNIAINVAVIVGIAILIGSTGYLLGKRNYIDYLKTYSYNLAYNNCLKENKVIEGKLTIPEEVNYTYFQDGIKQCQAYIKEQNKTKGGLK